MIKMDSKNVCYYSNFTSQMQIARIKNTPNVNFERVVFPGERFLFEALPEAQLEVYTNQKGREVLLNRIPCDRLRVMEEINMFELTSPHRSNSVAN